MAMPRLILAGRPKSQEMIPAEKWDAVYFYKKRRKRENLESDLTGKSHIGNMCFTSSFHYCSGDRPEKNNLFLKKKHVYVP